MLHIGCGANLKPGWVNVDSGADLSLDAREQLPFPDNSVTVIYSEHFFEHLSREDGQRFLLECARVLVPGGRLSIGVPDATLILRDYGDREKWQRTRDRYHPANCTTPMHSVNHFFRQGEEHKYAYDAETLVLIVREAGFSDAIVQPFGISIDPKMAPDSKERRTESLYVEGVKR